MPAATDHYRVAEMCADSADRIANADNWKGDRTADVANRLREAQVHATLALADAITEASNRG